ncbi:MAG: bifunctional uridylyltransferase/uridylyl-removing protein GlnD [Actinomycetota bacterium]
MVLTRSDQRAGARPDPVERLLDELGALDTAFSRGHHGRWSARRRAQLVDACLVELYLGAEPPERTALVALGGYGRGELAPRSDLDLLLLHGGTGWPTQWGNRRDRSVKELAERLFYPLWDAGFSVGHAFRSVRECAAQAGERLDVETAMLDGRIVAGDERLFESMHELVTGAARKDVPAFLSRLQRGGRERETAHGSVSHLLEPDVKEGAGGLRDIHTVAWIEKVTGDLEAAGALRRADRDALDAAEEFLVRVRSALHLETGKKTDRLHLDHQPWLATTLGFEDEPGLGASDALMRSVFEHGRRVEQVRDAVFDRLAEPATRAASAEPVGDSPEGVLALFARSATGARLAPATLDRIEAVELPEDVAWTPSMRESFIAILRAGTSGLEVIETMDLAGVLTRLLPEWAAVRCRPQRDPFHRYTVDIHLLQAVVEMVGLLDGDPVDRFADAARDAVVADRDALLLGALLHDIGKTGHGEHVTAGTRIAASVLDRLGVEPEAAELVLFLVEQHLLLADTATRRDLEDENLILDVAARVGTPERLAALYLLTMADAAATGPHAWTPWRATLVHDLVSRVQHVLQRGDMGAETAVRLAERTDVLRRLLGGEDPPAVERFLATMPRSYLLSVQPERAIRHFHLVQPPPTSLDVRSQAEPGDRPGTYRLTVVAHDRPGLLSRIAGALALSGLSILSAQVFTTEDGVAVDLFEVEGAFEDDIDEERWRRFRTTLRKALEGRLSLEYRVKEKRAFYPAARGDIPVEVSVDNGASDFSTVVEVGAPDRVGLLFDISRTLFELQLDVHVAKVATYGGRVVDAFYVRDVLGRKIEDEEHIAEIRAAITARLSD